MKKTFIEFALGKAAFVAAVLCSACLYAADRYWVAPDGEGAWGDTANWSTTAGGAGSASVPTSSDTAYFSLNSNAVDLGGGDIILSKFLFSGVSDSNKKSLLVTNGTLTISGNPWPNSNEDAYFTGGTIVFGQDAKVVNNFSKSRMKIEQGVKIVFKDNAEYSQTKTSDTNWKNFVGGTGTHSNELVIADSAKVSWTCGSDSIIGGSDNKSATPIGVVRVCGDNALLKTKRLFLGTFWNGEGNASGKGTLIVDAGTVEADGVYTTSDSYSATSTADIYLNGGTLSCTDLYVRRYGTRRIYANGGTVQARASFNIRYNVNLPQAAEIRSGGLTVDTQNYAVGLALPFSGEGTLTKRGSGVLTVTVNQTNSGGMDIREGTAVLSANVTAATVRDGAVLGVGADLALSSLVLESGSTVSNNFAESVAPCITASDIAIAGPVTVVINSNPPCSPYVILRKTEGTFSEGDLAKITVAGNSSAELVLAENGSAIACRMSYTWTGEGDGVNMSDSDNWCGGRDIADATAADAMYLYLPEAGTIILDSDIDIGGLYYCAGTAPITISGSGSLNSVDFVDASNASTPQTIICPVAFAGDINVLKSARYHNANFMGSGEITGENVRFEGGATGASLTEHAGENIYSGNFVATSASSFTATSGGDNRKVVFDNSTLSVANSGETTELYIKDGGRFTTGNATLGGGGQRLCIAAMGELIVTNNLTLSGTGNRYSCYKSYGDKPGIFKFEKATMQMTQNWFFLGGSNNSFVSTNIFYIGQGGLTFSSKNSKGAYCLGKDDPTNAADVQILRPWYSDFTVASRGNGEKDFVCRCSPVICTDDESGTGRTITFNGKIRFDGCSMLTVSGSGTMLLNSSYADTGTGPTTVADTATLAFGAAGASLPPGSLTVKSGATFAVTNSITTGVIGGSGTVALEADSTLAFNFSSTSVAPILAFNSGASLSLPGEGEEPVKVRITANEGLSFYSVSLPEKYQLSTNGKFTADDISSGKVVLDAQAPFWARSIGVEDGNLYVYTRAPGLSISVR